MQTMLATRLSQRTASVSLTSRNFGRKPMIQFLGPRNKLDKSIGAYASASHGGSASADQSDKKPLSLHCELEFADVPAARWARLAISEVEQEIINSGTKDIDMDWRNIRL